MKYQPLNKAECELFGVMLRRLQLAGTYDNPISSEQMGMVVAQYADDITGQRNFVTCVDELDMKLLNLFVGVRHMRNFFTGMPANLLKPEVVERNKADVALELKELTDFVTKYAEGYECDPLTQMRVMHLKGNK